MDLEVFDIDSMLVTLSGDHEDIEDFWDTFFSVLSSKTESFKQEGIEDYKKIIKEKAEKYIAEKKEREDMEKLAQNMKSLNGKAESINGDEKEIGNENTTKDIVEAKNEAKIENGDGDANANGEATNKIIENEESPSQKQESYDGEINQVEAIPQNGYGVGNKCDSTEDGNNNNELVNGNTNGNGGYVEQQQFYGQQQQQQQQQQPQMFTPQPQQYVPPAPVNSISQQPFYGQVPQVNYNSNGLQSSNYPNQQQQQPQPSYYGGGGVIQQQPSSVQNNLFSPISNQNPITPSNNIYMPPPPINSQMIPVGLAPMQSPIQMQTSNNYNSPPNSMMKPLPPPAQPSAYVMNAAPGWNDPPFIQAKPKPKPTISATQIPNIYIPTQPRQQQQIPGPVPGGIRAPTPLQPFNPSAMGYYGQQVAAAAAPLPALYQQQQPQQFNSYGSANMN